MSRSFVSTQSVGVFAIVWFCSLAMPPGSIGAETATWAKQLCAQAGVSAGLVVHVGTGAPQKFGALTAAFGAARNRVVQGLYGQPDQIELVREPIRAAGCYGRVTAEPFRGERLPYADNLVNLLVISNAVGVARDEQLRVLAPGGVALVRHADRWERFVKPRPAAMDDWTHMLHDASNNAVAADTLVGPPEHLQWRAEPKYTRHHERLASISVVVSAGGRLFAIVDQAPAASMAFAPQWNVVARDAFNGVELWQQPIEHWESYLDPFRSGPIALARTMVATTDRLFVTLGLHAPVSVLDSATGKTLAKYAQTAGAEEILLVRDTLYVVRRRSPSGGADSSAAPLAATAIGRKGQPLHRDILAIDTATGATRWRQLDCQPLPTTLAVQAERAYFATAAGIHCLDARTGESVWQVPRPFAVQRPGWSAPTLVVHDDVVLCADRQIKTPNRMDELNHKEVAGWLAVDGWPGDLIAYAARDGKQLWQCRCAETYHAPVDVFVADDLVWIGQSRSRTGPDFVAGRDLHTGAIERRLDTARAFDTTMPHHRCHRNRATDRFLVLGRTGVEFIDLKSGDVQRNHWVRGVCQYGTLPCNGLLYAPPHSCACYIESKLTGFMALAPATQQSRVRPPRAAQLLRGPAFASTRDLATIQPRALDWPTYRHDSARSGVTNAAVPHALGQAWRMPLGGRVSAPVVADGRVYVAAVDAHTIYALDARTGATQWQFCSGGRIDSPPTVAAGRVVFGSADGHIYCLRALDGALVWRFRAGPGARLIIANGQVESAWPVSGAVLVEDDEVTFVAGRSSYLDGGLYLYRLALHDGTVLARRRVDSRDSKTGRQPQEPMMFELPGALPDVLSRQEGRTYMRHLAFKPETLEPTEAGAHLYSPAGFLDNTWWHRTYWIFGRHFYSGYIGWYFAGRETPAGRLLVRDQDQICGFGYRPDYYRGATERKYQLFALDPQAIPKQPTADYQRANRDYPARGAGKFRIPFQWTREIPLLARAMVLTRDDLVICGPPAQALAEKDTYDGKAGAVLALVDRKTGQISKQFKLAALPVHDGAAVTDQGLYISMVDGSVCRLTTTATDGVAPLPEIVPLEQRLPPLQVVREPGLVGYWKLDEGEGPNARDSVPEKHDGQVSGDWVPGVSGTALATSGRPNVLVVPDNKSLQFGTASFTLAMWVRIADYDCRLMGKENFPENWWVINVLPKGQAELVLGYKSRPGHVVRATSKAPLPLGKWIHLAYAVDRKTRAVRCYVNGALSQQTEIPESFADPLDVVGRDLRIPSSHKPFRGAFDELRIYRRALAEPEIAALYRTNHLHE